jgi:threonine dehydrogenase-like Zn-dependent dehydrogenase
MRAVRSSGDGVEVVDVDEPDEPGEPDDPGGVISIRAASICGSDFDFIGPDNPFVLGHELAGVTDDGRPVAVEGVFGCGRCDQCTIGSYNRCRTMGERVPGLTMDGGMCERYAVPERALVPLPAGLDVADASLVEPMAVAWHGAAIGGVGPAQRVAVVGGGSIGLLSVSAALAHGAEEVGLAARHDHQIEAGERLGATPATGEYDVVFEAAGSESAVTAAVDLAVPGGTVVVLGVHAGGLPFLTAFLKEVRIVGSITYGGPPAGTGGPGGRAGPGGQREVDAAAALLAAQPEIAATLVTHRFPITDAAEAFRVAGDRRSGAIKVVVHP